MLNKLLVYVVQKASWKKAVLSAVFFITSFAFINFSGMGVAGLLNITGGANILDFEMGYSYEKAFSMLSALGSEGRGFYIRMFPLDFVFPFSYMLCYVELISLLIKHIQPKKWCNYLIGMPFIAMLSDWIENIGIITMLNNYPDLPEWSVHLASISGIIKFTSIGASIATIGVLFVIFICLKYHKKGGSNRARNI